MERLPAKQRWNCGGLSRCWTKTWNRVKSQKSLRMSKVEPGKVVVLQTEKATAEKYIKPCSAGSSVKSKPFYPLVCLTQMHKKTFFICVSHSHWYLTRGGTTAALTLGELNWPLVVSILEVSSRVSMSSDPMFSKLIVRFCVSPLKSWMDTVLDSSSLDIGWGVWADLHKFMKIMR